MHAVLASDPNDPSFCPETPSLESLGLLTASVDEEIEQVFLTLPDDVDALEPIRADQELVGGAKKHRRVPSARLHRQNAPSGLGCTSLKGTTSFNARSM